MNNASLRAAALAALCAALLGCGGTVFQSSAPAFCFQPSGGVYLIFIHLHCTETGQPEHEHEFCDTLTIVNSEEGTAVFIGTEEPLELEAEIFCDGSFLAEVSFEDGNGARYISVEGSLAEGGTITTVVDVDNGVFVEECQGTWTAVEECPEGGHHEEEAAA